MIARLGRGLSRAAEKAVPDPFILALLLTVLVAVLGAVMLAGAAPEAGVAGALLAGWTSGFTSGPLLAFALQMCLVLVTGHALALSPPVQRAVAVIARLPKSAGAAAALVAFVACVAAIAHWGLGAIVGAFLAREIGRHAPERGLALHYPLLGGAAYAGLAVWHGGLSGSAPLKVAEEGHFVEALSGVLPMSQTVFSTLNFAVTGGLLLLIPVVFYLMTPKEAADLVGPDPKRLAPLPTREKQPIDSAPAWLAETPLVGWLVGGAGVFIVVGAWAKGEMKFDLNFVNFFFLFLGVACQGSLRHYVEAIADGAKGAGAIILQFPFYFGILGLMRASGMIDVISSGFVNVASQQTFPVLAFMSSGFVNLLVPSGGGQWAVQGEVLLTAGQELAVDPATTIMAFSYGDAWTNMLQPFWALPLLGIMGLRAKDIIGYTGVVLLVMAVFVPAMLLVLG